MAAAATAYASFATMPFDVKNDILKCCDAKTRLALKLTSKDNFKDIHVSHSSLCMQVLQYIWNYINIMVAPVVYKKTLVMTIQVDKTVFWFRWLNESFEYMWLASNTSYKGSVEGFQELMYDDVMENVEAAIMASGKAGNIKVNISARNVHPFHKGVMVNLARPNNFQINI
jgi:hypothetical protein